MCFSSRHYPTISVPNCPEVVVEGANLADISAYVNSRLRFLPPSEADSIEKLHSWLTKNSSGVFLWAVLVTSLLLQDIDAGEPIDKIMKRLKNVPKRMEDLYMELCCSLRAEERSFSVSLIQWALFAKDDILKDLETTCLAARLSTHHDPASISLGSLSEWGFSDPRAFQPHARFLRLVKNASRGLIEYTSNTVQFIHETVREFFLFGPGFRILDVQMSGNLFQLSYRALVTSCINALELPTDSEHDAISSMQSHARSYIMSYARSVEENEGSNGLLVDRMHAHESKLKSSLLRDGESIIHFMSRNGITSSVVACLERGTFADDVGTLRHGSTPLIASLSQHDAPDQSLVQALVNHGADIEQRDYEGDTALMICIKGGRLNLVRYLLTQGADRSSTNGQGLTPFLMIVRLIATPSFGTAAVDNPGRRCMETEYPSLLREFIAQGADVNYTTSSGRTAIDFALIGCNPELVALLINAGARIPGYKEGDTPLLQAARLGHANAAEICKILIENGADIHHKSEHKTTPLMEAVKCGNVNTVRLLIRLGVKIDDVDARGWNAMHFAASALVYGWSRYSQTQKFEIVQELVDAGCSTTAENLDGQTPLQLALSFDANLTDQIRNLLAGSGYTPDGNHGVCRRQPSISREDILKWKILRGD